MVVVTTDELARILAKDVKSRSLDEIRILDECSSLRPEAEALNKKRILKSRTLEQEESLESIETKTSMLADLIRESKHCIVYTGAGISTSASIPDYRGPNGLWTQIRKTGSFSITKLHDLTIAEPTFTHMAIRELSRRRLIKHVVSQNCDGLHLRSGLPRSLLSEIHGNMYIEICPTCERQYYRQADITHKTSRFRHKTGRKCHDCTEPKNNNLTDTIVLFGERSRSKLPMNWERASKAANKADLIICLGSSLKTLRRYECLWPKRLSNANSKRNVDQNSETTKSNSSLTRSPRLAIVNLQYTSKDKHSVLKIHGRCDQVMELLMLKLDIQVPMYEWSNDPLNQLAIPFSEEERATLKGLLLSETRTVDSEHQSIMEYTNNTPIIKLEQATNSALKDVNSPIIYFDCSSDHQLTISSCEKEETPPIVEMKPNNLKIDYILPGWLSKGLTGPVNSKSYNRKKRRRSSNIKHPGTPETIPTQVPINKTNISS